MPKMIQYTLPSEYQLTDFRQNELGIMYLYTNIVVFEAREGQVVSYNPCFSQLLNQLKVLGPKPWGYISNRTQSYAVKPLDYKYLNKISSLKAFAIVSYSEMTRRNAILEAKFCKKPFHIFDNLLQAMIWTKDHL